MAKQKTKAADEAAKAAETPAAKAIERTYAEQTYAETDYSDDVVVEVGPRVSARNNKVTVVEEARNVLMTKAGYEAMERDEDGETTHIPSKLLGIPKFKTIKDKTVPGGTREDYDILYFPESEETDEEPTDEGEPKA